MKRYGRRITITGQRWSTQDGEKTQEVHYQYEEKVSALLDQIHATQTGYALLMDIDGYGGRATVTIWPPLSRDKKACFAAVQPHLRKRDAEVNFVPSSYGSACSGTGTSPEEVLFHELIHAAQVLRGVLDLSPIPKAPRMSNFAEFCAVTASNIFRSGLGRPGLRAGHQGRDAAVTLNDPAAYYAFFSAEIDRWFRLQPVFCGNVAQMARIPFNPLREGSRYRRG